MGTSILMQWSQFTIVRAPNQTAYHSLSHADKHCKPGRRLLQIIEAVLPSSISFVVCLVFLPIQGGQLVVSRDMSNSNLGLVGGLRLSGRRKSVVENDFLLSYEEAICGH